MKSSENKLLEKSIVTESLNETITKLDKKLSDHELLCEKLQTDLSETAKENSNKGRIIEEIKIQKIFREK